MTVSPWMRRSNPHRGVTVSAVRFRLTNLACQTSSLSLKTSEAAIDASEAKNRFPELLERVRQGAEVIITKHNRPVAKLVPMSTSAKADRKRTTVELRAPSKLQLARLIGARVDR